jgi:hypothetical protein
LAGGNRLAAGWGLAHEWLFVSAISFAETGQNPGKKQRIPEFPNEWIKFSFVHEVLSVLNTIKGEAL